MQVFGWIYTAKKIAEFEGITTDQAYDLPTIQALNTMSYLKAKDAYDAELLRQT